MFVLLKSFISQEHLSAVKGVVMHYVCSSKLFLSQKKRMSYDKTVLEKFIGYALIMV